MFLYAVCYLDVTEAALKADIGKAKVGLVHGFQL